MTDGLFQGLKGFSPYSYAANALERWTYARALRQLDRKIYRIAIIEGYEMAIEQFLKHIISHSSGLNREHVHSHKVWGLACDAQLAGRERYRKVLQRFSKYYDEVRYESDDPEERQAILDYLTEDETLNLADNLLLELHAIASDVDRSASPDKSSTIGKMQLF